MSFSVMECAQCGHRVYPARLWCPACGHERAREVAVEQAELLAWTRVPGKGGDADGVFATVNALPRGPLLVVRLADMPQGVGQRLRLSTRTAHGAALPWEQALPQGDAVPGEG